MTDPVLVLDNVGKKFRDTDLFRGVHATLRAGDILVVMGGSGIGKSTLLRAIAGLVPFEGAITVAGNPVVARRRNVGNTTTLVTQQANLWDHLTALKNVALVRRLLHGESRAVAMEKARGYLAALEVDHLADRYPFALSGGEQQRVSLARGFASEPALLLLDEVTSAVDVRRRNRVAAALRARAAAGTTIVMITHDPVIAQALVPTPMRLTPDGLVEMTERDFSDAHLLDDAPVETNHSPM